MSAIDLTNENGESQDDGALRGSKGSAHVFNAGPAGAALDQSRIQKAVAGTRQKVTWVTPVKELDLTPYLEDAADTFTAIAFAFDAPNDAVADGWLASADSENADAPIRVVPAGETRIMYFSGVGITRCDMIRHVGTDACGVLIGAA